jgi:PAS domain S-box-containing protein
MNTPPSNGSEDLLLALPVIEAVVLARKDGGILRANDKAQAIYGLDMERKGLNLSQIFQDPDEYQVSISELCHGQNNTGPVFGQAVHRDDKERTFTVHYALLKDPRAEQDGLLMISLPDSSEWTIQLKEEENRRKLDRLQGTIDRIQEELSEKTVALSLERRRLRMILEGMGEGMLAVGEDGIIKEANPVACQLLDLSNPPVGGKLGELWPQLEDQRKMLMIRVEDQRTDSLETQMQRDGRTLRINLAPLSVSTDGPCATVILLQDVTKAAEAELMREELISIVSHELRSPITSIKGYMDLILSGEAGEVSTQQKDFLQIIYNNTMRLTSLIEDILDLSRIESGKAQLDCSKVDVNFIINFILLSSRHEAESKEIHLVQETEPNLFLSGDSNRLQQVVTNFVGNAIKYCNPKNTIILWAKKENNSIAIGVSDNGPGIAPDELGRIFEKFYRCRDAHNRRIGGTGLGLAIARSIVEAHDSELKVESRLEHGSNFHFELPAWED